MQAGPKSKIGETSYIVHGYYPREFNDDPYYCTDTCKPLLNLNMPLSHDFGIIDSSGNFLTKEDIIVVQSGEPVVLPDTCAAVQLTCRAWSVLSKLDRLALEHNKYSDDNVNHLLSLPTQKQTHSRWSQIRI